MSDELTKKAQELKATLEKYKLDTGGPAFASVGEGFGNPHYSAPGMTLLDYFAAKAMCGQIANSYDGITTTSHAENIAIFSYDIAEAMVAEKRKREGGK